MKPVIELVFDSNGVLRDAYALHGDDEGTRAVQLPLAGAEEQIKVDGPSVTHLTLHSFRIRRTEA